MLSEKGVRFIHGVGFSSSNPTWTHVFSTANALETAHDEGN
jgi:predicted membrane protein